MRFMCAPARGQGTTNHCFLYGRVSIKRLDENFGMVDESRFRKALYQFVVSSSGMDQLCPEGPAMQSCVPVLRAISSSIAASGERNTLFGRWGKRSEYVTRSVA